MKILLIALLIAITVPQVDAQSKVQKCQQGFIGYAYNSSLNGECRGLWRIWSHQMMKAFNQK